MVWDSPLLTVGNLARARSRSGGRSPRGAGHGSHGNRVTHPPDRTMMPSPPPVAHLAPSSTDMVLASMVAAADHPPQDVVLVYTITSSMDSL